MNGFRTLANKFKLLLKSLEICLCHLLCNIIVCTHQHLICSMRDTTCMCILALSVVLKLGELHPILYKPYIKGYPLVLDNKTVCLLYGLLQDVLTKFPDMAEVLLDITI